jgi:hypothetical protein
MRTLVILAFTAILKMSPSAHPLTAKCYPLFCFELSVDHSSLSIRLVWSVFGYPFYFCFALFKPIVEI